MLSEDIINKSMESVQQHGPSQTVGDALGAYGAVQKLQQDKQDFEMRKQQNEISKATAFMGQMNTLASMPDSIQKAVLPGMLNTWKQMYPGMDTNFPKELMDPEYRAQMTQLAAAGLKNLSNGGDLGFEGAKTINSIPGLSSEQRFQFIQKGLEEHAKVQAAQLGGQAMRAANMQDNTVFNQVKGLRDNPSIKTGIAKGQAFDTDMDQLNNKPNWQTYQEAFMNYANSLTGMKGVISDAKLQEMQSALHGPLTGKWSTFATDNPGAAGNEASPEAVAWLKAKIGEVSRVNDGQIAAAARRHANISSKHINNKRVIGALSDEAQQYQGGKWRMVEGSGQSPEQAYSPSPPVAAPAAGPSHWDHLGTDEITKAWLEMQKNKAGGK